MWCHKLSWFTVCLLNTSEEHWIRNTPSIHPLVKPPPLSIITVTSWWARWRLRSPASRLFIQPFIQAQIKENIKAPRHWSLCGEFTGEFPAQRASNAENVSIWWRHHGYDQSRPILFQLVTLCIVSPEHRQTLYWQHAMYNFLSSLKVRKNKR